MRTIKQKNNRKKVSEKPTEDRHNVKDLKEYTYFLVNRGKQLSEVSSILLNKDKFAMELEAFRLNVELYKLVMENIIRWA